MSFVIAIPELVQDAAQSLAGIRSSLADATAAVAAPTTGIAAAAQDEVSMAIASMFGNFGQEFQVLSAQAQAFHDQFVNLLSAGAGAYTSAEAANVEQVLLGGVGQTLGNVGQSVNGAVTAIQTSSPAALVSGQVQAGVQAVSGAIAGAPAAVAGQIQAGAQAVSQSVTGLQSGLGAAEAIGAPGLLTGLNSFGATVDGPYQTLFANTAANLQSLQSAIAANPAPFLHQLVNNQTAYGQTIATALQGAIQGFPANLANLPADIQAAIQALASANPAAVAQVIINQQIGYAQVVSTALQNAANDFNAGVAALPAAFQTAMQDLMAGNVAGAVGDIANGFGNLFFTGFVLSQDPVTFLISIAPGGALGDLLPIFALPGQMAQNFTNLLPAGSIPAQISQNVTNVVTTLTDTSQTLSLDTSVLHVGPPLVLGLEAIGPAVTTLNAFGASANAFAGAVQAGDGLGAAAALIDAPAVIANGFLNGQATLPLSFPFGPLTSITNIPLGGIITPPETASLTITDGVNFFTTPLGGTSFGGILPGLLTFLPEQLAEAIGAPLVV